MDTRVAAYGLIVRDGEILLTYWHDGARWSLPGGGIEWGEPPADAAIREIFEETGFVASLGPVLGVDSIVIEPQRRLADSGVALHGIRIVYEAHVVSGTLTHEVGGSSTEARWFGLDEVATLPHVELVDFALQNWRAQA